MILLSIIMDTLLPATRVVVLASSMIPITLTVVCICLYHAYAYVILSQQKSKSHNIRSQPLIVLLVKRWITKEEGGRRKEDRRGKSEKRGKDSHPYYFH